MTEADKPGNDGHSDGKPEETLEVQPVPEDSLPLGGLSSGASGAENGDARASPALPKEEEGLVVKEKHGTVEHVLVEGDDDVCEDVDGEEEEGEGASVPDDDSAAKTLDDADKLMEEGSLAMKKQEYTLATDRFSRALEIRARHFGELGAECLETYYKYGLALLYKAQDENEALALGDGVKKKARGSVQPERLANGEGSSHRSQEKESISSRSGKHIEDQDDEKEIENEGNDGEDVEIGEEEEADLDLAFNLLDIARVIAEKNNPGDSMEKVNIISTLGDVLMEREDIEHALEEFNAALSMLGRLVEPDSRRLAEIHFKFCITLQMDNKIKDAVLHCKMAISICEARSQRLKAEISNASDTCITETEAEIKDIDGLLADLNEKLDDLQEMPSFPSLAEMMRNTTTEPPVPIAGASTVPSETLAKSSGTPMAAGSSNPVVHLGVVGRGVKRAVPIPMDVSEQPSKKPALSSPAEVDGAAVANEALDPDRQAK